jgi:hypothetical protein
LSHHPRKVQSVFTAKPEKPETAACFTQVILISLNEVLSFLSHNPNCHLVLEPVHHRVQSVFINKVFSHHHVISFTQEILIFVGVAIVLISHNPNCQLELRPHPHKSQFDIITNLVSNQEAIFVIFALHFLFSSSQT